MSGEVYEALARTAQLLRMDVFRSDPSNDFRIVDGLRATSARIVTDRNNVRCAAGQTAICTLYAQLAMLGLQIDVDAPNVDLIVPQPPFRELRLLDALRDYSDDLMPGGSSSPATRPDVTFVLGDTPFSDQCLRISGDDRRALVGADVEWARIRWSGTDPFGAVAAAAVGAADAARAAIPNIAERLDAAPPALPAWTLSPVRRVDVDLRAFAPLRAASGRVDVVSGGAITNAMIYSLLRTAQEGRLDLRVIEPESLDLSNLNRYAMARRSWVGQSKTSMLMSYGRDGVTTHGVPTRLDECTAATFHPWADRLAIGVDDIRSRWFAQREAAESWIGVGATSHDYVLVSEHLPAQPCAGCAHPRPDDADGPIPTIGFVSLWAGLMLALKVLGAASATSSSGVHVWPLGLENARGIHSFIQGPVAHCPVACPASRVLRPC